MPEPGWWKGDFSILNDDASDFILAVNGLRPALTRFHQNPHFNFTVIECAWWIASATQACEGRDVGVLEGFYWVRSKGIHELGKALGQIDRGKPGSPMGVGLVGVEAWGGVGSPARWKPLPGPEDGGRRQFNDHLASRPIGETLDEAFGVLSEVHDTLMAELGISDT